MFTRHTYKYSVARALLLIIILLAIVALPGGIITARELEEAHPLPVLQLRSYDNAWLRYYNLDENGVRKLANTSGELLSFRRVVSAIPLGTGELENAATIAGLIFLHDLSFDMNRIDGQCDTEKLLEKNEDVLCVPGGSALPIGYIFLTLYHAHTNQIAALTTTIDNSAGMANPAETQTADPAEMQNANPAAVQPAAETRADGCGPYAPGQWIAAEDYESTGLNLPTNTEDVGNPITDYSCVLPADGGPPYLQAYSLIAAVMDDVDDSGNSDDDGDDDDDDDDDDEGDDDDDNNRVSVNSQTNVFDC